MPPLNIKTNADITDLSYYIDHNTIITLDTETTGLNKLTDKPFMLLIAVDTDFYALRWTPTVARWLEDHLPKAGIVVAHNAKYDWHMMRNGGVDPDALYSTNVYCSMVCEALINEHRMSYSLDSIGMDRLGEGKLDDELYQAIADMFGGKPDKKQMARVSEFAASGSSAWAMVADYGIQDILLTYKIYKDQMKDVSRQDLSKVLDLEMNVLKALVELEHRGVPVDITKVDQVADQLTKRQMSVQKQIISEVGWMVNPRSPLEMEKAFRKLGIPITMSKTGKPTFAKDALERLQEYQFIKLLQESRNIKTMMDTFINGSIRGNAVNGRIHTDFNQTRNGDAGTGTGRLSSSNPNLQQIPKRDGELAPLIRGLFAPPKTHKWCAGDWEQFEFRVFAHYVKDPDLTTRYNQEPKTDFHTALAEMTGKPRDKAKRINLGLVFGMGNGKLAKELGLPYSTEIKHGKEILIAGPEAMELFNEYHSRFPKAKEILIAGPEAMELFNEYHSRFPKAKEFLQEASHLAKTRGYVKTIMGRRLRFPGGEFVHKAGGLVFQGTSADFMKRKLVELNDKYRKSEVDFVLVVHDEFCCVAPNELAEQTRLEMKEILEFIPELRIPILSDVNYGQTWWEAH